MAGFFAQPLQHARLGKNDRVLGRADLGISDTIPYRTVHYYHPIAPNGDLSGCLHYSNLQSDPKPVRAWIAIMLTTKVACICAS
jgi:hypothetical protein